MLYCIFLYKLDFCGAVTWSNLQKLYDWATRCGLNWGFQERVAYWLGFQPGTMRLFRSYYESAILVPFEHQWLFTTHSPFCFLCNPFAGFGNCEPSTWCSLWFFFWGTFLTPYLCMLLRSFFHLKCIHVHVCFWSW